MTTQAERYAELFSAASAARPQSLSIRNERNGEHLFTASVEDVSGVQFRGLGTPALHLPAEYIPALHQWLGETFIEDVEDDPEAGDANSTTVLSAIAALNDIRGQLKNVIKDCYQSPKLRCAACESSLELALSIAEAELSRLRKVSS